MKHLILTSALFLTATLGFAQNITEPEYKGQVAVINADSTTTLLQKETGEHKAKSSAFALVPIPGASLLDRTKAYLTVKGAVSASYIDAETSPLMSELVKFACASRSMTRTLYHLVARIEPTLAVVVVLPTPPLWLAIEIIFACFILPYLYIVILPYCHIDILLYFLKYDCKDINIFLNREIFL